MYLTLCSLYKYLYVRTYIPTYSTQHKYMVSYIHKQHIRQDIAQKDDLYAYSFER